MKTPATLALLSLLAVNLAHAQQNFEIRYQVEGMVAPIQTDFTTHTFTSCGKTGRFGPSLSQCQSAYNGAEVLSSEYNFDVNGGIQQWTVPVDGIYRIEAAGAQGGGTKSGEGAKIAAEIALKEGELLKILVGQAGGVHTNTSGGRSGGGGGGSFVVKNDNTPLVAAGGGGGQYTQGADEYRADASINESGRSSGCGKGGDGGTAGAGGSGCNDRGASAGGGLLSNGTRGTYGYGGSAFVNGGSGGNHSSNFRAIGGFGGGGGTHGNTGGGGGGGGYSGGGGGFHSNVSGAGGGGGSFSIGKRVLAQSNANTGHGYVTITYLDNQ